MKVQGVQRLVECVPNFSEGRDTAKIRLITEAIESVEGIQLLGWILERTPTARW